MHKILLVEDDPNLGFVIQDNMQEAGYEVDWQKNGLSGELAFTNNTFDIGVLDVMLPEQDGFTLGKKIKNIDPDFPIIFLTAKSLQQDRIEGLKIGADDYLAKPFAIEELLLRIKAILKRSGKTTASNDILRIGSYTFEPKNLKLIHKDYTQTLTQREAELLKLLILNKNQTLGRDQILIKIWGDDDYFKGRSLDVFITRLRKYLNADSQIKLVNIHGVGFKLEI